MSVLASLAFINIGAASALAGTFHFNQADVNLGRIMQGATPSTNLNLARGSNGTGTSNFSYSSNGITGPASRTASGNSPPAAITVSLVNNANGTASPFIGLRTWTVTMTSNLTAGQDGSVNVSATVLSNRIVNASSVNLGTAIVGGTWSGTSNLSTTGNTSDRTSVSVATTGGPVGGISVTGGSGTAFNAAGSTGSRSLSGSFATAGNKSGSVVLTTTGEGLAGESPVNVSVGYSAVALDHSNASFDSGSNQDVLNIDFGTVFQNSAQSQSFNVYNLIATAGFTAALDLDLIGESGDAFNKFSTDAATFSNLAAGSASSLYNVTFDTTALGSYSATYTLDVSDENIAGAINGNSLIINVTGNVVPVPEPATIGMLSLIGAAGLLRRRR